MRKRCAIGEIIGSSESWKDSYWFIASHGKDRIYPSGRVSTEIIKHFPTGITFERRSNGIREGYLPNLGFTRGKYRRTYVSVRNHWGAINQPESNESRSRNYKGMPFQKEWDRHCGGSFQLAVWEIEQSIGLCPSAAHELSVIVHNLGFTRGNLSWELPHTNGVESQVRRAKKAGATITDILKIVNMVYS